MSATSRSADRQPISWLEAGVWAAASIGFVASWVPGGYGALTRPLLYAIAAGTLVSLFLWLAGARGPAAFEASRGGKWSARVAIGIFWTWVSIPIAVATMISHPPIPLGLEVFEPADTNYAHRRFERALGRPPGRDADQVYARVVAMIDASHIIRFRFRDAAMIDDLIASLGLATAHCPRLESWLSPSWWAPQRVEQARCYEAADENDYWKLTVDDEASVAYFETGDF